VQYWRDPKCRLQFWTDEKAKRRRMKFHNCLIATGPRAGENACKQTQIEAADHAREQRCPTQNGYKLIRLRPRKLAAAA